MFRTYSKGLDNARQAKLAPVGEMTSTDGLRADLAPVFDDLVGGVIAHGSLVGASHPLDTGHRVILAGSASAPGVVSLEVSSDEGNTWEVCDSDAIPAGEHLIGIADVSQGITHYRVSFACGEVGASRVHFSTQARA
jgi:hypothetical protein